jgi:hypothetical protein
VWEDRSSVQHVCMQLLQGTHQGHTWRSWMHHPAHACCDIQHLYLNRIGSQGLGVKVVKAPGCVVRSCC